MMNKSDMCMIEVVSVKGVTGTISLMKRIEAELLEIGAVPHWGLSLLPWSKEMVERAFPHYGDWKRHQSIFGGETFTNPFIKNISRLSFLFYAVRQALYKPTFSLG
jgi:hypothetical protein